VNPNSALAYAAAAFSTVLALTIIFRKQRSVASWCFSIGMLTFALESVFGEMWHEALLPDDAAFWATLTLVTKSVLPGIWLSFSLTYSRGNPREFLAKSWLLLLPAFLLPVGVALVFQQQLAPVLPYNQSGGSWWVSFQGATKTLNGLFLIATVLILTNLERTLRSAVGTMRWRIKFVVLGVGVVFGARVYTQSEALLFSGNTLALINVETGALLIGCALITLGYIRSGFREIDVYLSRAVLHTSVTVLLVGAYLFVVGVLAKIVARTRWVGNFQLQAFVILLGIVILAVLLLSNRVRGNIGLFVSRHFKRPQHDFRQIWTSFTQRMSMVLDQSSLCVAATKLISETFNVLSVSIWLFDEQQQRLLFAASTLQSEGDASGAIPDLAGSNLNRTNLGKLSQPFDLEKAKGDWAGALRQMSSTQFRKGGNRICVPLAAGDRCAGLAILADRVGGIPYTVEELDLLKCIGDQVAVSLLNLRLTGEIMRGKELEAFQAISAFFVHDLKNAASTLSLMLQNLPVYFDDPAFRQDALRGIGETVKRINELIGRVGVLRHKLELKPVELDLNLLVTEALESLSGVAGVEVVKELHPLSKLRADREQLQSVVTNLLLNARDAVGSKGQVTVQTGHFDGWATLSVGDNGCGMSPGFVKDSLFRPFQTTKKKGLGIGMFQSKMIVEAHRGTIQVKSELGVGTTFRIMLPLKLEANET
jgi:putative PEP-CTERM system histidine kinase